MSKDQQPKFKNRQVGAAGFVAAKIIDEEFCNVIKQETLEEAAESFAHNYFEMHETNNYKALKQGFIEGAKWQQERSYSEEEVLVKLYECLGHFAYQHNIVINGNEIDKWFEQFKKK